GLSRKTAGEIAGAHARPASEALDRQGFAEPFARPAEQSAEAPIGPLHLEKGRELRLPARPTAIDDELLGRPTRDILSQIVGDQRQREIDSGRDARRAPHRAVSDENA